MNIVPTKTQYNAAFRAARNLIDESGYGYVISDESCRLLSNAVAEAMVNTVEDDSTPS